MPTELAALNGYELREITLLIQGKELLAQARTLDEVRLIRDQAEAIRLYLRKRGEGLKAQNAAAEIVLRASRKAGEILAETVRPGNPQLFHDGIIGLSELGIGLTQSHRWQQLARLDDAVFEDHIQQAKDEGRELTTAGALRLAAKQDDPPDHQPEPWSLEDATDRLRRIVYRLFTRWPADELESMGHLLVALGQELLKHRDLRP